MADASARWTSSVTEQGRSKDLMLNVLCRPISAQLKAYMTRPAWTCGSNNIWTANRPFKDVLWYITKHTLVRQTLITKMTEIRVCDMSRILITSTSSPTVIYIVCVLVVPTIIACDGQGVTLFQDLFTTNTQLRNVSISELNCDEGSRKIKCQSITYMALFA